MNTTTHPTIRLTLSTAGFKGADLDEVMPDFQTERDVSVALKWFPSATGPETWTLVIAAGMSLGGFLQKFGELIAEDIHSWSKKNLKSFFKKRPNNHGTLVIDLESITIYSDTPIETIESGDLISVLSSIDPTEASSWTIDYNPTTGKLTISPDKP